MRNNGLSKLLRHGVLLLAIVFVCDRALGWWLEHRFYRQKHGDDVVSTYTIERSTEDVLIMGGSKASHDYRAADITAETGLSCFNGGRDNMDVIYIDAVMRARAQRNAPKVLVVDATYLDLTDYGNGRRTNIQRTSTALIPYARKHPELYPTVSLADRLEPFKAAISHIYPFNSLIGSIIQNTYTNFGHESDRGYEPLHRTIDSATYTAPMWGWKVPQGPLYPRSVEALDNLIRLARERGIRLIAVVSPFYFPFDFYTTPGYRALQEKITTSGFEFYDFSHSPDFLRHPKLFDDDVHLNDEGAAAFTRIIAGIIRAGAPAAGMQPR